MEIKSEEMNGFEKKNDKSIRVMCRETSQLICNICPWYKFSILISETFILAFSEFILGLKHHFFLPNDGLKYYWLFF